MSPRREATVSPFMGWPLKASPSAVQSLRVPVSKSRLSGLPSAPTGSTPSGGLSAAKTGERQRRTTSGENRRMTTPEQEDGLGDDGPIVRGGGRLSTS